MIITWMLLILTILGCGSNDSFKAQKSMAGQQKDVSKMITITKIKKPWYAPKGVVVKKMKETIPVYRQVKGLVEKNYSFAEGTKDFGGIYHWTSENEARAWFNKQWFDNIGEKYGVSGQVEYYEIIEKIIYLRVPEERQSLWAMLNYEIDVISVKDGLVEVIKTIDESGKTVTFSLWMNKSKANAYIKKLSNAKMMFLPSTIYN